VRRDSPEPQYPLILEESRASPLRVGVGIRLKIKCEARIVTEGLPWGPDPGSGDSQLSTLVDVVSRLALVFYSSPHSTNIAKGYRSEANVYKSPYLSIIYGVAEPSLGTREVLKSVLILDTPSRLRQGE
jgi:hypothetical protein